MNKPTICILAILLSLTFNPSSISAQPAAETTHMTEAEQAKHMLNRLDEIKKMDPKQMSKAEKKNIRREVKAIEKKLSAISGGVYISAGALIVILILLIIFL
jgi:hypothetical protein